MIPRRRPARSLQPVQVQQPLPPTLAYSDATKIGEAAIGGLAQAEGGRPEEWVNAVDRIVRHDRDGRPRAAAGSRQLPAVQHDRHQHRRRASLFRGDLPAAETAGTVVQIDERGEGRARLKSAPDTGIFPGFLPYPGVYSSILHAG